MRKNKRIYKQKRKHVELSNLGPLLRLAYDDYINRFKRIPKIVKELVNG